MYKVQQYNDVIGQKGADAQKRYSMIERLSKHFTVHHELAVKMDEILARQLGEKKETSQTPRPKPAPKTTPQPGQATFSSP
jgi:hypothetical protein